MNKNSLKEILATIKEYRQTAHMKVKERKEAVYDELPRLRELDNVMTTTAANFSRELLSHPEQYDQLLREMKRKLEELKTERAVLLTENNIPLDYFDPIYQCNKCDDTGHTNNGEYCHCVKQKLIESSYNMSHIKRKLERENFSTFTLNVYSSEPWPKEKLSQRENMQNIVMHCESFTHSFSEDNNQNLLFYGPAGLGKTFLCNSIAKALLDKSYSVLYQTPFTILDIIEQRKFAKNPDPSVYEAYDMLFSADLLIIDDLGSSLTNSLVVAELFNIINQRLIAGKKMVISMNMNPRHLRDDFSERIASRIWGNFQMIKFYGPDVRVTSRRPSE